MDNNIIIITIIAVVGMAIILPIVYNKTNFNFSVIYDLLQSVLNLLGNMNVDNKYKDIMDLIIKYSKLAVEYAEQLYLNGTINAEERKATAIKYMEESLALQNIDITDTIRNLIEATIEAAVYLLPPTNEEEYIEEYEIEDERE